LVQKEINLGEGVNEQLLDKCTLVELGAKIDRVVLSIDIILLTSLLIFYRKNSMARLLSEKSLIKLIS